jgi:hypothetical protein
LQDARKAAYDQAQEEACSRNWHTPKAKRWTQPKTSPRLNSAVALFINTRNPAHPRPRSSPGGGVSTLPAA